MGHGKAEEAAWELLPELERQEFEVRQRLEAETASLLRTGVAMIDYAIDQVRFFLEAWRSLKAAGLTDLDALDRAELLTLPEGLRYAKTTWQKERLLADAASRQWRLWQRVLFARRPDRDVGLLRRDGELAGQCIQLWPYPTSVAIPPPAMLPLLEASIEHDHGLRPSPVYPMRPLQPGLCWALQLDFFHLHRVRDEKGCLTVLIDPPWDFDLAEALAALRARADEVEAGIESARRVPQPPPEKVILQWRAAVAALRADIGRLAQASPSERAAILHRWFAQPETMYLTPVSFVTDDMPPDVMAELMGLKLKEVGLLSVREVRRFDEFVVNRHLKDRSDLSVEEAHEIGARLARFQRPLRQASLTRYEAKVLEGVRHRRPTRPRLGKRLQRIAAEHRLHVRTVYKNFRTFISERRLPRDARALKLFARSIRRPGHSRSLGLNREHHSRVPSRPSRSHVWSDDS